MTTTQPTPAPTADPTADRALKARHRAMWALGDYPTVASTVVAPLGHVLVEACRIGPGDRVLDVAAGSGTVALPAAAAGAEVVASDLTPELLEAGRAASDAAGLGVEWAADDAEALPYAEHTFDVVTSCVGVMFAPHHQAAADELVRVCRTGGRLGLVSWTPEGFIGRLFATMRPYVPAPPAGVQPPPLWGKEDHVRALLGDRVVDVVAERRRLPVTAFATGAEFRDFFKTNYGPTIAAYRGLADDADRVAALDAELAALPDEFGGAPAMEWEYLLLTARRAD